MGPWTAVIETDKADDLVAIERPPECTAKQVSRGRPVTEAG